MSKLQMQFASDVQGHKFADVMADTRIRFNDILDFLDEPARRQRMLESELHHDRAPLAAIVRELEARPDVTRFLSSHDAHTTTRFRPSGRRGCSHRDGRSQVGLDQTQRLTGHPCGRAHRHYNAGRLSQHLDQSGDLVPARRTLRTNG